MKLGASWVAPSVTTWLSGGVLSTVLLTVSVAIAGLLSKTIEAQLVIEAAVASEASGRTKNVTLPSPSGAFTLRGRKPSVELSARGWSVPVVSVLKLQISWRLGAGWRL